MAKFYCDSINQDICRYFHPHTRWPECNGYCGEYYEYVLIQDFRGEIFASKGNLTSLRGGILVQENKRELVRDLYKRIQNSTKN